jgi:multiple sugar transport system substrate-binding protein
MAQKNLSRRQFLRGAGVAGAGLVALLAGCQPKIVEVTKIVEKEVEKVVQQTVVVTQEKVVEKEKVVKETVVVQKEAPKPTAAPFELVHWAEGYLYNTDAKYKPYQDAVANSWKDKYPNVGLKFVNMGWDEVLRQNLVTALLGGTAPDVIVGENFFQQYADLGAMAAVDDEIQDIKDNLIPGTYAASVTGGKTYGINQFTGIFGFERNPNVIEQAGLDPSKAPETWDDLLAQCATITKAGNGKFYGYTLQGPVGFSVGGIFRVAVYLKQADAEACKEDCTLPYFNNPKAEQVHTYLRAINKFTPPGLTFNPDEGQVYSQLFKGVSAYQICGSWHVQWAKDSGLQNAMYSGIPIPKGGKKASIVVGNVINGVLTASKHIPEAIALCKMFTEDPIQDLVNPILGRLPSTKTSLKKLQPKADAPTQAFIGDVLTADLGVLPQWRKEPQKLWQIYNDFLVKVLSTEEPIKSLMDEAQQNADTALKG